MQSSCVRIKRNTVALLTQFSHLFVFFFTLYASASATPMPPASAPPSSDMNTHTGVLAWPAWLRVLALLPALVVLWLAVAWALAEAVSL
jgi:hypothetical protein